MLARLTKNRVTQCHAIKTRVGQALAKPSTGIMTGNLSLRGASTAKVLSGLQMNNKMFIT
jgi:glycine dehydrogenase